MKKKLPSLASKATKEISNGIAFVLAIALALTMGCLVFFVS